MTVWDGDRRDYTAHSMCENAALIFDFMKLETKLHAPWTIHKKADPPVLLHSVRVGVRVVIHIRWGVRGRRPHLTAAAPEEVEERTMSTAEPSSSMRDRVVRCQPLPGGERDAAGPQQHTEKRKSERKKERGPNLRIVLFWVRDEGEGPITVKDRRC